MEQPNQLKFLPKNDEFLKVFLAMLIADGVLGLVQTGVGWSTAGMGSLNVFSMISGILSFAVFILAITSWVRCVKRKYPKFILWTSIARVFVPLVLGILTFAISAAFLFNTFQADPTIFQTTGELPSEIAKNLRWLTLLSLINSLLFIGLGVTALLKIRKA